MKHTSHIIPNHLLFCEGDYLVVPRMRSYSTGDYCKSIYITGSTKTSLWTHYNKGVRNYCGVNFSGWIKEKSEIEETSYYAHY